MTPKRRTELLIDDEGQDIAEYAVMLAVILVICRWHDAPGRHEREHGLLTGREFDTVSVTEKARSTSNRFQETWEPWGRLCPNCGHVVVSHPMQLTITESQLDRHLSCTAKTP